MAKRSRKQKKRRAKAIALRSVIALLLIIVIFFLLFGAVKLFNELGNNSNATTLDDTISITRKGAIVGTILESFDKEYYSELELKEMTEKEIAAYQQISGSSKSIDLKDFEVKDGKAELHLNYASDDDYRAFNGKELYVGTIQDLLENGINFNIELGAVEEDATDLTAGAALGLEGYHAIVLEENIDVKSPGKILYCSDNVSVLGKKEAKVNENNTELAYIIYK
ncbi:MAG: hypothetical protein PHY47_07840 [Lachnospiraceae bacterium]|nr:hypothetical protein [Lachnospiraceae bacterium]